MEEALRLKKSDLSDAVEQGFNPCFNGRGVKTIYSGFINSLCFHVSILVLMEEALRLLNRRSHGKPLWSFNPCFNGRGVKTYVCEHTDRPDLEFQSLF